MEQGALFNVAYQRTKKMMTLGILLIASGFYAVWESEKIIQEKHDRRNKDE